MIELAKAIQLPVSGNPEEDKYSLSKELLRLTKELKIKHCQNKESKKKISI